MSFVTEFGFTGFSVHRFNLYGHADTVPLTRIRCGIVTFIRFRTLHPVEGHDEFFARHRELGGLSSNQVGRGKVRANLNAAIHKAKKQARAEVADEVRYWREAYQEQHGRVGELQQGFWAVETTVKTLSGMTHPKQHNDGGAVYE